jgi:proline iminopeptidase
MRKQIYFFLAALLLLAGCEQLDPEKSGNLVPKTVDEDPALPAVQLSQTKLHVQTFGQPQNPKIFILKGGPGADFRYMLELNRAVNNYRLSDQYFVVYHDYRSTGLSRRHPTEELTRDLLLSDFEELVARYTQPDEKIILIGHSYGGFVAAQYMNKHPERIKGAVLLEPADFNNQLNKSLQNNTGIDLEYLSSDVNKITWMRQFVSAADHATGDYYLVATGESVEQTLRGDTRECWAKGWRAGAAIILAISFDRNKEQFDVTPGLSLVQSKVLFITGGNTQDIGYDF